MKWFPIKQLRCLLFVFFTMLFFSCGGGGSNSDVGTDVSNNGSTDASPTKLGWPLGCEIGVSCTNSIGFPDIDGDWVAFDCGYPGYPWHTGTDLSNLDFSEGVDVLAAADGEVVWVLDGKYDACEYTISEHPDCAEPSRDGGPNVNSGYMSCTDSKPEYCDGSNSSGSCYWCTYGGNQIVIKHFGMPGIFATGYDHLMNNSATVRPGDRVVKGQKIATMGSAGKSSAPHLHFSVFGSGFGQLVDPWAGECGPNTTESLWEPGIQESVAAAIEADPWL